MSVKIEMCEYIFLCVCLFKESPKDECKNKQNIVYNVQSMKIICVEISTFTVNKVLLLLWITHLIS